MDIDTTKVAIDLSPLIQDAFYLLGTVLLGLFSVLAKKAYAYIGLKNEGINREVVNDTLQKAIGYAYTKLEEKGYTKIETNQVVGLAANYAITRIPDTLKAFNLDKPAVSDLILARLGFMAFEAEERREPECPDTDCKDGFEEEVLQ